MATNDIFLHSGLTPSTDIELYPSAASGTNTQAASVTGVGVVAVSKVESITRVFVVSSVGVVTVTRIATLSRTFATTGVGVTSVSFVVIPGTPIPPDPSPYTPGGSYTPAVRSYKPVRRAQRKPVTHRIHVGVESVGFASATMQVNRKSLEWPEFITAIKSAKNFKQFEEELLLIGAF